MGNDLVVGRPNLPLASAGWLTFPEGSVPTRRSGDLFLGSVGGQPVGVRDKGHALVVAGTRSGKGVSFVLPNLLLWEGSAVLVDPKGENTIVAARRRGAGSAYAQGMGQKVVKLDPFGEASSPHDALADIDGCYNPLDAVRHAGQEAIDIAAIIAESMSEETATTDAFFDPAGRNVLRDIILHVASARSIKPEDRNLLTVRDFLVAGDKELRELVRLNLKPKDAPSGLRLLFQSMQKNTSYGGHVAKSGMMLQNMLESPRTLMSIMQVARNNSDFIDSPPMRRILARSTFQLAELKTAEKGMTLSLCLPQRYAGVHARWLRMMITLVMAAMEKEKSPPRSGHAVLMMLDEFALLKRMKAIENAAAQIAGYGVRLVMVAQTLAQLKDHYKDGWETLVANAGVKLFFGNEDYFTQDYVSKLMGDMEVSRWTDGYGSSHTKTTGGSHTVGTSTSVSTTNSSSSSINFGGHDTTYSTTSGVSTTVSVSSSESFTTSQSESFGTSHNRTEHVQKRALMTPDEVRREVNRPDAQRAIAVTVGQQPLLLDRAGYFQQSLFDGKFDPHPLFAAPPTLEERKALIAEARRRQEIEAANRAARAREQEARRRLEQARQIELARERDRRAAEAFAWRLAMEQAQALRRRRIKILCALAGLVVVAGWIGFSAYVSVGSRPHQACGPCPVAPASIAAEPIAAREAVPQRPPASKRQHSVARLLGDMFGG